MSIRPGIKEAGPCAERRASRGVRSLPKPANSNNTGAILIEDLNHTMFEGYIKDRHDAARASEPSSGLERLCGATLSIRPELLKSCSPLKEAQTCIPSLFVMLAGELKLDVVDPILEMVITAILILKSLAEFIAGVQTGLVQFKLFPEKC